MARVLQGEHVSVSDSSIVQDMIDASRLWGDKIYMKDTRTKKTLTFLEYLDNGGCLSQTLRNLKQTCGKKVGILSDTCIESLTFVFGVWLSGAAAAAFNPSLPQDEIIFFLKTLRCEVIFCGQNYLDKVKKAISSLEWSVTIICPCAGQDGVIDFLDCLREGDSQAGLQLDPFLTGKDHIISILFTSGTTGVPKGVTITDRITKFNSLIRLLWDDKSRLLLTTPMYWVSNPVMMALSCNRGSLLLIASKMSNEELMQTITMYKPTEWFTGPAMLMEMCQNERVDSYDFSSFQAISMGGSILLPDQRRTIVGKLLKGRNVVRIIYGSTEVGIVAFDDQMIDDLDSPKMASVGRVAKGVTIKIVDESGKLLPPNSVGEICVKSPGVFSGYINKSISEEEMDKDSFWHMGDLGYYDEDGYIYITARLKDVIKYRGQQIAPAELEAIIERHPDVIESCVLGKTCLEMGGDLPTAFVVKRPDSTVTEQDLYDFISDNVIDEKKLRGGIFFMDSLPKSEVGKVLRHVLQQKLIA